MVPAMGKDFKEAVFIVDVENGNFKVRRDLAGSIINLKLSDIPNYSTSYPVTRGIDHPNEISAYMFAEYFKSLVDKKIPFQNQKVEAATNTEAFLKWLSEEMHNRKLFKVNVMLLTKDI